MYMKLVVERRDGFVKEEIRDCARIIFRRVTPGQPSKPVNFDADEGLHVSINERGDVWEEVAWEKEDGLFVNIWLMNDNGKTIEHYAYQG